MMENATFRDYLREYVDIKGVSIKKLADSTGIPERYIEALLEGGIDDLPPPPYVRGYIGKLAEALEFDKEEMWRLYKRDIDFNGNSSGIMDRLPSNRYVIKKINKKMLALMIAGVLLVSYLGWNFNKLLGAPRLEITYPASENLIVQQPLVPIEGKTDAGNKLTINDEEVYVDEDGRFAKDYSLNLGLNVVTLTAKKFLGKETQIVRQIIYKPPASPAPINNEGNQENKPTQ